MDPILFILLMIGLYFLPGLVATMRDQRNANAIFVLNLFLGWTVLGWVIALVWACMDQPAPKAAVRPKRSAYERVTKGTL